MLNLLLFQFRKLDILDSKDFIIKWLDLFSLLNKQKEGYSVDRVFQEKCRWFKTKNIKTLVKLYGYVKRFHLTILYYLRIVTLEDKLNFTKSRVTLE